MQTQTSNTPHNAIMEAGSKDRPPMLAPGNYVYWKSRIKRHIDTKPNHELIHYCLTNPPYKLDWKEKEVPIFEGSPITRTERILIYHFTSFLQISTQQDIYTAGSENRPPMLNLENYVPCSSRLLWYAKSRPNGKLINNSIINGPYVRRMIPEPGDSNREVHVNETFHVQTDDALTEKELKQIEADD
nr:hypothetical protein [Tanacetum cinerariifolium]